jgi:hypothetical protein
MTENMSATAAENRPGLPGGFAASLRYSFPPKRRNLSRLRLFALSADRIRRFAVHRIVTHL